MGWIELLIILVMLALNSVFAAYELALASVSAGRLKLLADRKHAGAAAALAMKDRMEASLAVVQIGITVVGAIAAATGGSGAEEGISPYIHAVLGVSEGFADFLAIALVVAPLSAATIIFGELVPKTVGLRNNEWVCLKLSPIMRVFGMMVYPAMAFCEWATKVLVGIFERKMPHETASRHELGLAELRAQAHMLRTERVIGSEQERIILGASKLTQTHIADILVHAQDIALLDADASLEEHFVKVHLEGYTRFPVTERPGDPQAIIGYVNLKEIVFLAKAHPEAPTLRSILRPLIAVAPEASIGYAFSRMMTEHVHLAVVRDSKGTVRGIITLEDILEEIVGDIQDEFDRLPRHVVPSGNSWVVGGGVKMERLREVFAEPALGGDAPPDTQFADWVAAHVHGPLRGGDTLALASLKILVRKTRRQKIFEALVASETDGHADL